VSVIAERCDRLSIEPTGVSSFPGYGAGCDTRTRTARWFGSSGATRRAWPASSG
jgi:hypothetical protein